MKSLAQIKALRSNTKLYVTGFTFFFSFFYFFSPLFLYCRYFSLSTYQAKSPTNFTRSSPLEIFMCFLRSCLSFLNCSISCQLWCSYLWNKEAFFFFFFCAKPHLSISKNRACSQHSCHLHEEKCCTPYWKCPFCFL